ncbi:hypothetical protein E9229_003053 [Paeniglutamicibacter cryotolerans]|uniref:Uncharacterized protein n=1 Tax=Paeniglutamicibacter cryotolerans TaxID=670079 RepID=A0A839QS66_9MICC|nr:hypothetical protein [Paeniglutamicibacter cryotolerans]
MRIGLGLGQPLELLLRSCTLDLPQRLLAAAG